MNLFSYIRSPYEIRMNEKSIRAALDLLVRYDIPFYGLKMAETTACFYLYAPYFREYERLRGERRFAGETRKRLGLIPYLARYKARAGLLVGGVLGVFLLVFSSLFVWDITVSGTETIPESAVLTALEENGLVLGSFIPRLDTERLEGVLALELDGLSFVSVNLRGTVASVELRERERNTEPVDTESPSNLVAAMDGQIESVEVVGGRNMVKAGDIVKKGDILASGIIDSTALGYRLVRARGVITARTSVTLVSEIPLETTEKVYTGEKDTHYRIKFFAKTLNFYKKDGFSPENCDTIEESRRLYLFGIIKLPIFMEKTVYAYYEETPRTLSEAEALEMAKDDIRRGRDALLSDAEILARHTEVSTDGKTLILRETVDCILDIAKEVKLGVNA